ncbi:hypothetical protein EVAR_13233_1 [Eumeta japonica]|uniref:Reverse transcriptase domain-containing protein n=1 Tax=Eumeta variegata TaxID=151549 RepID=A0A4C1TS76_EUMVA|nr:hypothetical protein EVAR_13233_1 [Eumeta japonica]
MKASEPTKLSRGTMSTREVRTVDLRDFLDSERLNVLNEGNTPTFENAVTFAVQVDGWSGPRLVSSTLIYNTAKALWSEFGTAINFALNKRTLTFDCAAAIPYRSSKRRLKSPWWSSKLEGLKGDACTKKWRIRNSAPSKQEYVVGEYVQAKEVYKRAVAKAQTWKRFCSAQDGESLWNSIYRVVKETGKNLEDVLLQADTGQVLGPDESATLLAENFVPDTLTLTICFIWKPKGKPTEIVNHPQLRGICPRCTHLLPGLMSETLLKNFILKRPRTLMGSHRTYARRQFSGTWVCSLRWRANASSCNIFPVLERGCFRQLVVAGAGDPTARSKLPSKPSKHDLGALAGPTLWNLILDSLLRELGELSVYVQAFVNDVIFICSGESASSREEDANRALTHVHSWRVKKS